MKKYCKLFKAAYLFCIGAAFFACASSVPAQQATVFGMVEFTHTVNLLRDIPDPRMTMVFSLLEAGGNVKDIEFINKNLYQGQSPAQYKDAVIQEWQTDYLENREYAGSQDPLPAVFNWEYWEKMDFNLFKERGMTVRREIYTYSGGAHGMGTVKYSVFDLADKRVLKMDDFFRDDTVERLYSIVKSELLRYNNARGYAVLGEKEPLSQGIFFSDNPALTDNFFINKEGMGLNWEPYKIAHIPKAV